MSTAKQEDPPSDVLSSSSSFSPSARKKTNISSSNVADTGGIAGSHSLTRIASPLAYQSPASVHRNLNNALQRESAPPPKPRESLLAYKQKLPSSPSTSSNTGGKLTPASSVKSSVGKPTPKSPSSKTSPITSPITSPSNKSPAGSPSSKPSPSKASPSKPSPKSSPSKLSTSKIPAKSSPNKSIRAGSAPSPPPSASGTSLRLAQNKGQIKSFEHVRFSDYPRLEFLYLRDNSIQSFHGMPSLNYLKIIDLSNNAIDTLEHLTTIPTLKELYLSSNLLTTINNLPTFPQLEILSLSYNMLSELKGIRDQPELKGFFISNNNLSTLSGFPSLPKLEHLRIDGNPVLYQATGKLCALVVAGQRMEKLDGQVITQEIRERVLGYPIILASAIREGYIFGETTFNIPAVCHQYLIERQKLSIEETVPNPPCRLRDIH